MSSSSALQRTNTLGRESYNRKLDDVFGVEGEVAGAIAEQLNAKLSGSEKQELAAKATNNSEAYDAYLRGLAFFENPDALPTDFRSAVEWFETAVRLDANFALAWARLSNAHSSLFFNSDSSAARRDAAHKTLDNAVRLEPDLLETQLAQAYYYYFIQRDYERARHIFEQIRMRSPNNSEAPRALALTARRQGRWNESLARFHEAIELDPRNLKALMWVADTHIALRQFPGGTEVYRARFGDRSGRPRRDRAEGSDLPGDGPIRGGRCCSGGGSKWIPVTQPLGWCRRRSIGITTPLSCRYRAAAVLSGKVKDAAQVFSGPRSDVWHLEKFQRFAGGRSKRESQLFAGPRAFGSEFTMSNRTTPFWFSRCRCHRCWLGKQRGGHKGGRAPPWNCSLPQRMH